MSAFILQSLILLAIAFVVGFLLGLVFQRWRRVMKAKAARGVHGVTAGGAPATAPVGAGLAHAANGAAGDAVAGAPAASTGEGAVAPSPAYESSAPLEIGDALPTGAGIGSEKESSATARTVPTERPEASVIGSEDGAAAGASGADEGSGVASASAQPDEGTSAKGQVSSVPKTVGSPASGAVAGGAAAGAKSSATPASSGEATYPGRRPPTDAAPQTGGADDLKKLKGIGPQNEQRLNALGIYHFRQIAAWTEEEAQWVGSYLAFPGRIEREDWIGQAKAILSGTKPEDLKLPSRRRQ